MSDQTSFTPAQAAPDPGANVLVKAVATDFTASEGRMLTEISTALGT
jgi:hypothetical protein